MLLYWQLFFPHHPTPHAKKLPFSNGNEFCQLLKDEFWEKEEGIKFFFLLEFVKVLWHHFYSFFLLILSFGGFIFLCTSLPNEQTFFVPHKFPVQQSFGTDGGILVSASSERRMNCRLSFRPTFKSITFKDNM